MTTGSRIFVRPIFFSNGVTTAILMRSVDYDKNSDIRLLITGTSTQRVYRMVLPLSATSACMTGVKSAKIHVSWKAMTSKYGL